MSCPGLVSVVVEAFAAAGVVLLDPPVLEQRVAVAGWWVLQDDLADQGPSVGLPVTAAEVGEASAGVGLLQVSDREKVSAAVGKQMIASELEGSLPGFAEENPDQRVVAGLEELPDLEVSAGLEVPGWALQWSHQCLDWLLTGPVLEVALEAVDVAEMGVLAEDHLQNKKQQKHSPIN